MKQKSNIWKYLIVFLVFASLVAGLVFVFKKDISFTPGKPGVILPGEDGDNPGDEKPGDGDETPGGGNETPNNKDKKDITGVALKSKDIEYDGSAKSLEVTGKLPNGVTITYYNNSAINIGTYNVEAVLTGTEYNKLVLNANMRILAKQDENTETPGDGNETPKKNIYATLTSREFIYDGTVKRLELTGNVPAEVEIVTENNSQTEIGNYIVQVTLTGEDYNTLVLNANLRIVAPREETETPGDGEDTPKLLEITGMALESQDFEFDGSIKSLELTGELPEGVSAVVSNNSHTAIGTYTVRAVLSGEGYKTLILNANLRIVYNLNSVAKKEYTLNVFAMNLENSFKLIDTDTVYAGELFVLNYGYLETRINNMIKEHNPYITVHELFFYSDNAFESQININNMKASADNNIFVKYSTIKSEPSKFYDVIFKPVANKSFNNNVFVFGENQTLIGFPDIDELLKNAISDNIGFDINLISYYEDFDANILYNKNNKIISDTIIYVDYINSDKPVTENNFYVMHKPNFNLPTYITTVEPDHPDYPFYHSQAESINSAIRSGHNYKSIYDSNEIRNNPNLTLQDLIDAHIETVNTLLVESLNRIYGEGFPIEKYLMKSTSEYLTYTIRAKSLYTTDVFNFKLSESLYTIFNTYYLDISSIEFIPKIEASNFGLDDVQLFFNDAVFEYDGTVKSLKLDVIGTLPEGAVITYSGQNYKVGIGTYLVNTTISVPGFKSISFGATMKIVPGYWHESFAHIGFKHDEFEYDGTAKTSVLYGTEFLPNNAVVTYFDNTQVEPGMYSIYAIISMPNYNDFEVFGSFEIFAPKFIEIALGNLNNNQYFDFEYWSFGELDITANSQHDSHVKVHVNDESIKNDYISISVRDGFIITSFDIGLGWFISENSQNLIILNYKYSLDEIKKYFNDYDFRISVNVDFSNEEPEVLRRVVNVDVDAYAEVFVETSGGDAFFIDGVLPDFNAGWFYTIPKSTTRVKYVLEMPFQEILSLTISTHDGYVIKRVINTLSAVQEVLTTLKRTPTYQLWDFNPRSTIKPEHIDNITISTELGMSINTTLPTKSDSLSVELWKSFQGQEPHLVNNNYVSNNQVFMKMNSESQENETIKIIAKNHYIIEGFDLGDAWLVSDSSDKEIVLRYKYDLNHSQNYLIEDDFSINIIAGEPRINLDNIQFDDQKYDYDGNQRYLIGLSGDLGNLPNNVNIEYVLRDNNYEEVDYVTLPGWYLKQAIISADGYASEFLVSYLIINHLEFPNITYIQKDFKYDGSNKSIIYDLSGFPEEASVDIINNQHSEPGDYRVSIYLSHPLYNNRLVNVIMSIYTEDYPELGNSFAWVFGLGDIYASYDGDMKIVEFERPADYNEYNMPYNTEIEYINNQHSEPGEYWVTTIFRAEGYRTLTVVRKLTILNY